MRPTIVYDAPETLRQKGTRGKGGYGRAESTYGGKIVENVVQGTCRDLLAMALILCERNGLPVVMHTHDEIISEVPAERAEEGLRQLLTIMEMPPAWAVGFPIATEGFVSKRYAKQPL
jgi:DNA polymerase